MSAYDNLIFVDCEATGPCPSRGRLTEFGAVAFASRQTFHGILVETRPSPENAAIPEPVSNGRMIDPEPIFVAFEKWIMSEVPSGRPTFVSDNPAFDWQWINDGFHIHLGRNPFGFSARRISDFYAGLVGDWTKAMYWKRLRVTAHDHNPVHDSMGNVEAFARLLRGER